MPVYVCMRVLCMCVRVHVCVCVQARQAWSVICVHPKEQTRKQQQTNKNSRGLKNVEYVCVRACVCVCVCVCVYPAVIGDLTSAGVQIHGLFARNSNGPGGTSGAHTTRCEERPVLL